MGKLLIFDLNRPKTMGDFEWMKVLVDELFEHLAKKYNITKELVYKKVNYYTR